MPALHAAAPVPRSFAGAAGPRADGSRARRRTALLKLARRHGEVRLAVREQGAIVTHAPDVLDLLDELNESGRLAYGGLQRNGDRAVFVYRPT